MGLGVDVVRFMLLEGFLIGFFPPKSWVVLRFKLKHLVATTASLNLSEESTSFMEGELYPFFRKFALFLYLS